MPIFPTRRSSRLHRRRHAAGVSPRRSSLTLELLEPRAVLSGMPAVLSVTPPAGGGTTAGGGLVTIAGNNFEGVTAVKFGTTAATVKSATATSITVTQPALPVGFQDVTVTTPSGTSSIVQADQYLVDPLVLTITNSTGLPANTPIYVGIFAKVAYVDGVPANVPLTATGTAAMSGDVGQVGSLVKQNVGAGYAPTVTIAASPGGGTQAAAAATDFDTSGGVTTLAVTNNGTKYGEIVTIAAPPTRPAVITGKSTPAQYYADIDSTGAITGLTVMNTGSGYQQWFTFGGTGANAAYGYATVDAAGAITSLTVQSAGSGLTASDTFSFSGSGSGADVTATLAGDTLLSATVKSGGSGYFYAPSVTFAGGDGKASATPTLLGGSVTAMAVATAGSGYGPTITVADGTGLQAQAVITGNAITKIEIVKSGSGYAPSVTFSKPSEAGTTATAAITALDALGGIKNVTITNPGSGYTAAPTVTVGGNGKNAALAAVGAATVTGVTITNPGLGYSSPPKVVFTGGGAYGPPAAGTASASAGGVTGVTISSGGQYFSAPTVAFDAPPSGGYSEKWVGFNTSGQFGLASHIETGGNLPTYQLQFTGGVATLQMPNLYTDSVRIVFGVNSPPVLPVESDGSVAAPSMENPSDKNHTVFWDFIEYTLNQQNVLYIDTSAVDQFGIPISVTIDAPDPAVPGGVGTLVGRDTLFGTQQAMSFAQYLASVGGDATAAFGSLTTQQGSGTIGSTQYPYRVLAPQDYLVLAEQSDFKGTQPPAKLKTYFDSALQSLYNATSRSITLVVPNPNAGTKESEGNLTNASDWQRSNYVFTGTPAGTSSDITFKGTVNDAPVDLKVPAYTSSTTPTTDAFAAEGIFAPGDTGQTLTIYQNLLNNLTANIKNQIASAVNRGIVNVIPSTNPAGFGNHLGMGVKTIAVAHGGSGYTAAPSVTIAPPPNGPNASPATGVAVMSGDTVTGVIIIDPGNGYDPSIVPAVTFSRPQNAGDRATAGAVGFGFFDTTAWVGTQTNLNKDHLPFYQPLTTANQNLGFTPSNFYAGYFHATINGQPVSRNNLAYAFPYDDQGNQSSTMVSTDPQSVAITLTSWGGSAQSPAVKTIDTNPGENPTGTPTPTSVEPLKSVTWTVMFNEPVTGLTRENFSLDAGTGLTGTLIQSVAANGTGQYVQSWTVTANSGTGTGLLGLNMTSAAGVYDAQSQQLSLPAGGFTGEVYSVRPNPVGPTATVTIPATAQNPTAATMVTFDVAFTQAVTGLSADNFTPVVSKDGVTGATVHSVSGSGKAWTVTVNTGSGSGTLALTLDTSKGLSPTVTGLPVTSAAYTIEKNDPTKPPDVHSIALAGTSRTAASSVSWNVTFTEPVTGVTAANFALVNGGLGGTPLITGVTPTSSTSTSTWTVTASTGSGSGTLGLNMTNSTNVQDADLQGVANVPFTKGAVYTIDRTAPALESISRSDASPTALSSVSWTVTFSEPVSGVSKANFLLKASGLSGTQITQVSQAGGTGTVWTVTALTGSGNGTLQLNMVNAIGITDAVGLAPTGIPFFGGQPYQIQRGGATIVSAPISFMTTAGTVAKLAWPMQPFADSNSMRLNAALSVSPAAGGMLRAISRDGVTVTPSGSRSAELQFSGTVAALNAYFQNKAGFISYTPTAGSLAPRTLTLSALGRDGLSGLATAALLVRSAAPQAPAPAVRSRALLGLVPAGQPVVITYSQLVAATGATQTTSRSIQFMLAGLSSGRLEVWSGSRWSVVPSVTNIPLLAPGGQIRWTPPAAAVGVRPAFSVKTWDGWRMSGVSHVLVHLTR
jgi:hypothetical protein